MLTNSKARTTVTRARLFIALAALFGLFIIWRFGLGALCAQRTSHAVSLRAQSLPRAHELEAPAFSDARHLIVVAGHSVLMDYSPDALNSDKSWFLQTYQRGQAQSFFE